MMNLRLPVTLACLTRVEACRDFGTNAHERRVAATVYRLARTLDLAPADSRQIARASILHDIGKMAVPLDVLQKSVSLSPEEVALVKKHAEVGSGILTTACSPLLNLAASIALCHHERYDGTGYPNALMGDDIPLPAQITSICDVYDALRQDRPYRRGMTHDEAMKILMRGDGRTSPSHFEPRILAAFREISEGARTIFETPMGESAPIFS